MPTIEQSLKFNLNDLCRERLHLVAIAESLTDSEGSGRSALNVLEASIAFKAAMIWMELFRDNKCSKLLAATRGLENNPLVKPFRELLGSVYAKYDSQSGIDLETAMKLLDTYNQAMPTLTQAGLVI